MLHHREPHALWPHAVVALRCQAGGGALAADFLHWARLMRPHGVLIWGQAGFRAPRERGLASALPGPGMPPLTGALLLCSACLCLVSLSSLPSLSVTQGKAGLSPGIVALAHCLLLPSAETLSGSAIGAV